MTIRQQMLDLLQSRPRDYSLAQPFYNDGGFFRLDMDLIWYTQWLFAGMSCEIPKAGNYFTMSVGETSLVIVRGRDNAIRAFYNTCRHRGSRVCTKDKGNAAKLVCPYHQWTYDLDGRLVFAGNMDDGFDPKQFSLKAVHCETVAGYIFVNLSEGNPPDFQQFRRNVEPYMLPHDLENARVAFESSIVEKANWKLVIENNRECYHCAGNHPELIRTLAEFDNSNDPRIDPKFKDKLERKGLEWDAQGLPNRSIQSEDKRYRIVRLPFQNGESMTLDGKPACKRLLGNLADTDLGSLRILSLPNSWNHLQGDHAIVFRVLPLGPQETLVTTKWLVHKEAKEGVDYYEEPMTQVWLATNDQDRRLAEDNQQGINSKAYQPGPYSRRIEFGVIDFIDWYSGEIQARLAESDGRLRAVAG